MPVDIDGKDEHMPCMDPELLRQFGITRVGDVTGLDTIGVPVWFAVRPNSRGLSVSQGKGLTAGHARVSAIMEAIEGAVAEDTQRHLHSTGSIREMTKATTIPFDCIGRVDTDMLDLNRERAWVRGTSLRYGHHVLAPFELIGMDFRVDFPWDRGAFHMSSEGLAAGFDYDRTVLHALLELVENDACLLVDAFNTRNVTPQRVSCPADGNRSLDDLIRHLDSMNIVPRFFDLTGGAGIPVVMASIPRLLVTQEGPTMRQAAGVACRIDWHEAALAALLEAIQARLTDISGSRDDLSPVRYSIDDVSPDGSTAIAPDLARLKLLPSSGSANNPLWRMLAEHLLTQGIGDIYVFSLETGMEGLHVVRVLANGLSAAGGGVQKIPMHALDGLIGNRGRI